MRDKIIELITRELKECSQPFLQEMDLQVFLFNKLRKEFGEASVYLEYPIISPVNGKNNDEVLGYIDLVVEADGSFYPIELKYKTKPANVDFFYFGKSKTYTLKKHSAYNLNCYGFWADISRMEQLSLGNENIVKRGIGVFVTNDSTYKKGPSNCSVDYAEFSLKQNRIVKSGDNLKWKRRKKHTNKLTKLKMKNESCICWNNMEKLDNYMFCIV
jgi:hypothetical protein